jgi:hypothetical protein
METKNRNILIAVIAAAALLCCCCMLVSGGLLALRWSKGPSIRPDNGSVILVITPDAIAQGPAGAALTPTPTDRSTPTAGAFFTATATAIPTGTVPTTSTPAGAGFATARAVPATRASDATVVESAEIALAKARMPARDQRELAMRLKPNVGDIPATVNAAPPSHKTGDKLRFWVENSDTQEHRSITATLKYVTQHVYVWIEDGVQINESALRRSADRFEQKTYPTDREFFGSEWTPGVDNDVHLSILHAQGMGKNIAGYYSSADEYSHLVNPYSNEKEMFYISAGDGKAEANTSFYDGVLAHEFQHMIHWHNDAQEDSWVNEGMSELAAHLNGFDTGGAEYAYAAQPDTQLTTWSDPSEGNAEHYGAAYLFMDYFLDRFGEQLTRAVVASKRQGVASFNEALAAAGRPERFDDVFADWLVANYLDKPNATPKNHFGYADIDPPAPTVSETITDFPTTATAQVGQYAADYIELRGRGDIKIAFSGQPTIKVVNTEPHGRYAWYSNRGDDSDATLTRSFDLRRVPAATLTFSAWYNIEDGWDYAYAEVSTDGGKRWQIVHGRQTTDKNPAGNAFGEGWTGISGGGPTPQWIAEQIDLTPYAGKEIQLRFEYITDDAVNGPGFLLDNIAIPEINYKDDAEHGQAGWQAAGWVLMDNTLPEGWLVQVVASAGDSVTVQRMRIGPDGKGELSLPDASRYDHVMMIVSALAPVTTERAAYTYTVTTQ